MPRKGLEKGMGGFLEVKSRFLEAIWIPTFQGRTCGAAIGPASWERLDLDQISVPATSDTHHWALSPPRAPCKLLDRF